MSITAEQALELIAQNEISRYEGFGYVLEATGIHKAELEGANEETKQAMNVLLAKATEESSNATEGMQQYQARL